MDANTPQFNKREEIRQKGTAKFQGYLIDHNDGTETLYAIAAGVGALKSDPIKKPNDEFDSNRCNWKVISIEEVPQHAEFIGYYNISKRY